MLFVTKYFTLDIGLLSLTVNKKYTLSYPHLLMSVVLWSLFDSWVSLVNLENIGIDAMLTIFLGIEFTGYWFINMVNQIIDVEETKK